jgi:hypothetical protein
MAKRRKFHGHLSGNCRREDKNNFGLTIQRFNFLTKQNAMFHLQRKTGNGASHPNRGRQDAEAGFV